MIQRKVSSLQADVADGGLFFERRAIHRLAADSCSESQPSALSRSRFTHLDRNAAIAQRNTHPFGCGPRRWKLLPRCRQKPVHGLILGIGIVVKQNKISDFRIPRDFYPFE